MGSILYFFVLGFLLLFPIPARDWPERFSVAIPNSGHVHGRIHPFQKDNFVPFSPSENDK
jgi:hypothetical protein